MCVYEYMDKYTPLFNIAALRKSNEKKKDERVDTKITKKEM